MNSVSGACVVEGFLLVGIPRRQDVPLKNPLMIAAEKEGKGKEKRRQMGGSSA